MNDKLASIMAQIDGLTDDERRSLTDFLNKRADDHFMKELEEMSGPAVVCSDHGSHSADDDGDDDGEDDTGERYSLDEWIDKETDAYRDYLAGMMYGWELIEEYHRQGGEDVVYFDPATDEIIVSNKCLECGGRMVGVTTFCRGRRSAVIHNRDCWCTACGAGYNGTARCARSGQVAAGRGRTQTGNQHYLKGNP